MTATATITSKGQVTIPKRIRDHLSSNVIEFDVVNDRKIVISPVDPVGGSLRKYADQYVPLSTARKSVQEQIGLENKK